MTAKTLRTLRLAAAAGWVVVAGYAVREMAVDEADDWEVAYNVLLLGLLVAAVLTLVVLATASDDSDRPRLRIGGLAVSSLGVVAAFLVAWAVPVWTSILGVGFGLLAIASAGRVRRVVGLLAAAQLAGLVTQLAILTAGVGEDVAAHVALLVTATVMVTGLAVGFGGVSGPAPVQVSRVGA